MGPYATGGVYVNLLGTDEQERVPAAYGPNFERLAAIKARWDPGNLFHANHNIPPSR
jgi:FAD/FMN-containing dehydrogenase